MLPKLMSAAGAFLTALGGVYVGLHIEGELSFFSFIVFAIGVVWLSQAPAIALRKRVRELELKLSERGYFNASGRGGSTIEEAIAAAESASVNGKSVQWLD